MLDSASLQGIEFSLVEQSSSNNHFEINFVQMRELATWFWCYAIQLLSRKPNLKLNL